MKRFLFLVGFLLALLLLVGMRVPYLRCEPYIPGTPLLYDERDYLAGAKSMLAGDNKSDMIQPWLRAPGTAWLLMMTAQVRGLPIELAACDFQRVQIGLWALIMLLITWMAATLFDRRVALVCAFVVAVLPVGLAVTWMVHADTLFIAAEVATIWSLLMFAKRGNMIWVILGGILAGAAALTRSTIVPLLPVLTLWTAVSAWRRAVSPEHVWNVRALLAAAKATPARTWLRAGMSAALFLVLMFAVVTPWGLRNQRLYGSFIISDTTGAVNLFDNNAPPTGVNSFTAIRNSSSNPAERQRFASRRAREVILADPIRFARKFVETSWFAWGPEQFSDTLDFYLALTEQPLVGSLLSQLKVLLWLALPLSLVGVALAPPQSTVEGDYRLVTLGIMLVYTAMIGATHLEDRYRLPYMLLWLPYAGWCIAHPRVVVQRLRQPARLGVAAGIAILVLSFGPTLGTFQRDNMAVLGLYGRGLLREQTGDFSGALADQQAAARIEPRFTEAMVATARAQTALGERTAAEQTLRMALARIEAAGDRAPADATVALQSLLREDGQIDQAVALDSQLAARARQRAEAMAWGKLGTPQHSLAIGGDDLGQVRGFYAADPAGRLRWSRPNAQIQLAGNGMFACLEANASRPDDMPAPVITLRVERAGATTTSTLHPPRNGWAWLCAPVPEGKNSVATLDLETTAYIPFAHGQRDDARTLGVALRHAELRDGPLALDHATGLLLDNPAVTTSEGNFQLLGASHAGMISPGSTVGLTLWWRGAQPPPAGAFTFLHLLGSDGQTLAAYNAPLANDKRPMPWDASEPLPDLAALTIPADLAPGTYRLVGGAFDPASGAQLVKTDLGELNVQPSPIK